MEVMIICGSIVTVIGFAIARDFKIKALQIQENTRINANASLNKYIIEANIEKEKQNELLHSIKFYYKEDKNTIIRFLKQHCNSIGSKPIEFLSINPLDATYNINRFYEVTFSHLINDQTLITTMRVEINSLGEFAKFQHLKEYYLDKNTLMYKGTTSIEPSVIKMLEEKKIEEKKKKQFIYLMKGTRDNRECYKIGLSDDPIYRQKQFMTPDPDIELYEYWEVTDMRKAEEFLHSKFESKRYKREWFFVTPADVKKVIDSEEFDQFRV